MRAERKRYEWVGLAAAVIVIAIFAVASPEGTSRLVSVQKLPANMDACDNFDQPVAADFNLNATTPREQQLLAELQQAPAPGAQGRGGRGGGGEGGEGGGEGAGYFQLPNTAQQLKTTAELRAQGARVPVRTIRDTAPTYSSIQSR